MTKTASAKPTPKFTNYIAKCCENETFRKTLLEAQRLSSGAGGSEAAFGYLNEEAISTGTKAEIFAATEMVKAFKMEAWLSKVTSPKVSADKVDAQDAKLEKATLIAHKLAFGMGNIESAVEYLEGHKSLTAMQKAEIYAVTATAVSKALNQQASRG